MKILIVAPHKSKIGTTRVTIETCNVLVNYFEVCLLDTCGEWDDSVISNRVKIIFFPKYIRRLLSFIGKRNYVRGRIFMILTGFLLLVYLPLIVSRRKIDLIYSSLISFPALLIKKLCKVKVIISVQGLPKFLYSETNDLLNKVEGNVRSKLWYYFSPDLFFFMTQQTLDLYKKFDSRANCLYLPNPVIASNLIDLVDNKVMFKKDKINFLCIGRLTSQKNYSLLIDAVYKSKIKYSSRFYILGEGEQRALLQRKVKEYELEEVFVFMGYVSNPFNYINSCDAFIQTSLWEDPGHALIEAALFNKILISSDCPNGPSEILRKGRAGVLFENGNLDALIDILDNFDSIRNTSFELPDISKYTLYEYEINLVNAINKFIIT